MTRALPVALLALLAIPLLLLRPAVAEPATAGDSDEPASGPEQAPPPATPGEGGGPTWALGIGAGVITLPDYVGSDERRILPLPIPYVEYKSRFLVADRSGLAGILPVSDALRLELSVAGALPVDSSDNDARRGMDDLDWIGEAGPVLKYRFYQSTQSAHSLTLELPLRSAFALDWNEIQYIGWTGTPGVEYRYEPPVDEGRLSVTTSIGPVFSDGRYNNYFYGVPDRDARAGRPAYNADGGYSGAKISGGISRRFGAWWVGAFARYINIEGAVFDDSPLVRTNHYFAAGLGAAWIFASSSGGKE
jgi:outer membrane scaffolding protein for murein synthesis (MipA/OmpV family)